jgi:hypothetical protein
MLLHCIKVIGFICVYVVSVSFLYHKLIDYCVWYFLPATKFFHAGSA